ncbi:MAG TPA: GTPase, partial [Cyanobacteria bacterium UBA8543]|nr:GTPase [Cyanobacteria bacterium UBA8543]
VNPNDRSSVLEALVVLMALLIANSDVKLSQTP